MKTLEMVWWTALLLVGCAGPQSFIRSVVLAEPVGGVRLDTGAFPGKDTLRKRVSLSTSDATLAAQLAPSAPPATLALDQGYRDELVLYHTGAASGRKLVAVAIPTDNCGYAEGLCDDRQKGDAVAVYGWTPKLGMLHTIATDKNLYLACRPRHPDNLQDEVNECSFVRVYDREQLLAQWGPFEPIAELSRRWLEAQRAGIAGFSAQEERKILCMAVPVPALAELEKALEAQKKATKELAAQKERRPRIAKNYGKELDYYAKAQFVRDLFAEADAIKDSRPVTAASLKMLAGVLTDDPVWVQAGKLELDKFTRSHFTVVSDSPLPHAVESRPEAELRQYALAGGHAHVTAWEAMAFPYYAPSDLANAVSITMAPPRVEFGSGSRGDYEHKQAAYEVDVYGPEERFLPRIAQLQSRLAQIDREIGVQRSRLGIHTSDQAATGLIADEGKGDPAKYRAPGQQGGGLSGSASWRIQDAEQQLRDLGREREQVSAELGRIAVPIQHKETRHRKVMEAVTVTTTIATLIRPVVARGPGGATGTAEQHDRKDYGTFSNQDAVTALIQRDFPLTAQTIWTALKSALAPKIGRLVAAAPDERERALIRFTFGFEPLPKPWPEVVMGELLDGR